MDAAYKTDLKEVNEVNFAQFDAKLEQRIAELRSDVRTELAQLRTSVETSIASINTTIERRLGEQTRFFFLAWAALLASILAVRLK